jgi:hypothetical protein
MQNIDEEQVENVIVEPEDSIESDENVSLNDPSEERKESLIFAERVKVIEEGLKSKLVVIKELASEVNDGMYKEDAFEEIIPRTNIFKMIYGIFIVKLKRKFQYNPRNSKNDLLKKKI